jgi:uncharacterized membrane protein (UPF0136 family)
MNLIFWSIAIYSILLIIGGIMGFIKAGSLISLAIGVGSGLILGYCAWSYRQGNRLQCMLIFGLTTAITLFFAWRFLQTFKIFPPAVMVFLGLAVLGVMYANRPKKC